LDAYGRTLADCHIGSDLNAWMVRAPDQDCSFARCSRHGVAGFEPATPSPHK
jgi:hypothetical protein